MTDQVVDTSGPASAAGTEGPSGAAPRQFFGRERELKELKADIERAGLDTLAGRKAARARVLLIAGRPGSGRTALAEELTRALLDTGDYADGLLRVRLTELGGAPVPTERTARDLLDQLEVAGPPGADGDELSQLVRETLADRHVLLLLDDAADAEQVDPLLPDNPGCLVVATAQGPLTGIPGVRPCTIGGLDKGSAVQLLAGAIGQVRITVDPLTAESLAEECGGQPAALVMIGGWLAAHPMASVADVTKQLRELPDDAEQPTGARPLARAFQLVYESLPQTAGRILRLLALAPAGLADAHTASALAGCSVSSAQSTLDDFVRLGLLRTNGAELPQYEVPGCLAPLLQALLADRDRPAEIQLARARLLERTVRQLQSCRAITEPEGSEARRKLAGLPSSLRFPHPEAAAAWLRIRRPALLASARIAVEDGELDTLARRLVAALVRALAAHQGTEAAASDLYGLHGLVLAVAERRELPRERAAALLNLADLDARTGRTREALTRYRAALDAGRAAKDPYATGRAMESVGGAYAELGDFHRASDWYGRAPRSGSPTASSPTRRGCTGGSAPSTPMPGSTARRCGTGGRRRPGTAGSVTWPPRRGLSARPRGCRSTRGGRRSRCAPVRRPSSGHGRPRTYGCRPRWSSGWPTRSTGSATRLRPGCTAVWRRDCWARTGPPAKSVVRRLKINAL